MGGDTAIDWEKHVTGIPGSTCGDELAAMVSSGDFTAYQSPHLRGELNALPTHLSMPGPSSDLRVIEVFCFPNDEKSHMSFRAYHDVLYAWNGTSRMVGAPLVPPLGTLDTLFNLPDALMQALMKRDYYRAPKFEDRDVLYVTDQGLFHQGASGGFYMAGGHSKERNQSQGLLRWDDILKLPVAGDGLVGPDEPLVCEVGVGVLVTMGSCGGPRYKAPKNMVSFELQSKSTETVKFGNRFEQRPAHIIPVNQFQSRSANNPHPRAYPHSSLLYKMIEAGIEGKLPKGGPFGLW